MKDRYIETISSTAGTILCVVAFLFAFGLPKMFFLLTLATNLSLCLGVEWIANSKHEYSIAYLMAAIATIAMSLLAYHGAHIAWTFIPSAIVSGCVAASATREDSEGIMHGVLVSIFTFMFLWVLNVSIMRLC